MHLSKRESCRPSFCFLLSAYQVPHFIPVCDMRRNLNGVIDVRGVNLKGVDLLPVNTSRLPTESSDPRRFSVWAEPVASHLCYLKHTHKRAHTQTHTSNSLTPRPQVNEKAGMKPNILFNFREFQFQQ